MRHLPCHASAVRHHGRGPQPVREPRRAVPRGRLDRAGRVDVPRRSPAPDPRTRCWSRAPPAPRCSLRRDDRLLDPAPAGVPRGRPRARARDPGRRAAREQLEEQACPNCGYPIEKTYLRCPNCRGRVKDPCHSCGKPIDPRWTICPYCETPQRPRPAAGAREHRRPARAASARPRPSARRGRRRARRARRTRRAASSRATRPPSREASRSARPARQLAPAPGEALPAATAPPEPVPAGTDEDGDSAARWRPARPRAAARERS